MMALEGGSFGLQIGGQATDFVLLVMNDSGVQKLLQNKVNLGADASVAAGPLGRRGGVSTDAVVTAEILSYSRTKGLFAGIDLSGGVLRPDEDANKNVYGAGAVASTILATREMSAPPEAAPFLSALRGTSAAAAKPFASGAPSRRSTTPADDDIRGRVIDIQQAVDRLLADATPAPVGTSGTLGVDAPRNATAAVDRARLMQIREQLDGLIATLNHR